VVLTMEYCTWKNHVFGLCLLCNVSKKHDVSETESVSSSGKLMVLVIEVSSF
jgi:hypothetical protein